MIKLLKVFPLDESIAYVVHSAPEHTYREGLRGSVSFTELRDDYTLMEPAAGQFWAPDPDSQAELGASVRVARVDENFVHFHTNAGCGRADSVSRAHFVEAFAKLKG